MIGRVTGIVVAVAMLSACGRDKAPEVPVQQTAGAGSTTSTAPVTTAPPTKAAPGGGTASSPAGGGGAAPSRTGASAEAQAAAELASAPRVRTVQVASLPSAAAARWWVAELQRNGIPAYTTTVTVDDQQVTRLRIGAAVTAAEARALADKIRARYNWPVWITLVSDRSELPPNALLATRNYIR